MRKFTVIKDFEISTSQIEEWLRQNPLPKSIGKHEIGDWEDFHIEMKTHYNTLKEFLKLKSQSLKIILNDNNALGILGESIGDLILQQDFKYEKPPFRHESPFFRAGVLSGTVDVSKAYSRKNSSFYSIGREFAIDYKAYRNKCIWGCN